MANTETCERCGHALEILRRPVRELRWSRHWMQGVRSLFTGPLKVCHQCGAVYSPEGELVAAGAVETGTEHRLDVYRKDMANLRNAFGGVVIAAGALATWLAAGPQAYHLGQVIAVGSVGVAALVPFVFFDRKARLAKRDLKRLRKARRSGQILTPPKQGS